MKLHEGLESRLKKVYEPSSFISMKFKGNDIGFKTDDNGNPILLFIGKKTVNGSIKGQRYARTLKRDGNGNVYKDHWDLKGKST